MLLPGIKKFFSLFGSDRKREKSYLKSEMHLHALPGQSNHQSGRFTRRKNRFAFLNRLLPLKKTAGHVGYKEPASSRKLIFKLTGLVVTTVSLLLLVLIGGGQIILHDLESLPFFQVSEIVISGTETVSEEKLWEASGIILHQTSLIGLNCSKVEEWLGSVPWVAKAEVERNWPSTVEISIVENVPVALLHSEDSSGDQLEYIDRKGVPFLQVKPGADIDFPIITGLTEIDEPSVKRRALAEVLVFLKDVNGNDPHLPAQSVSEIHVNQDGEMVVYLVEYPFPIFFGNSNTSKSYLRLVQVLKALYKKQKGKEPISEIEYIQMDYLNDKVLVAQSESG